MNTAIIQDLSGNEQIKALKKAYALNVAITSRIPIWMAIIFCPGQKEEKRNMIISKCSVFPAIEAIYDKQSIVC